jgi:serine/threonine protein kinase
LSPFFDRTLAQENVVSCRDWWQTSSFAFMVLERADMALLAYLKTNAPLDGPVKATLALDIVRGLAYCHEQKVLCSVSKSFLKGCIH